MTDTLFTETTPGRFHPSDAWTSKDAARRVGLRAGTDRYRVLTVLAELPDGAGMTGYELAGRLGMLATAADTRRKELAVAGYVSELYELSVAGDLRPVRRPTDSGRLAQVHAITADGRRALRDAGPELAARHHDAPRSSTPAPLGRPSAAEAARSLYGLRRREDLALEFLLRVGTYGLTDYELGLLLGTLRTTAGSVRLALERAGYVERTERGRPTDRKRAALVHVVTEAGLEHFRTLTG